MLAAHPGANIIERRLDDYPVRVKVYGPDNAVVFETAQRNLFRKYAAQREQSIQQIKDAVKKY